MQQCSECNISRSERVWCVAFRDCMCSRLWMCKNGDDIRASRRRAGALWSYLFNANRNRKPKKKTEGTDTVWGVKLKMAITYNHSCKKAKNQASECVCETGRVIRRETYIYFCPSPQTYTHTHIYTHKNSP